MNNFNTTLTILDVCCSKCFKCQNEKTVTITEPATLIPLQNCFSLRVISATQTRILIMIKKDYYYLIRYAYLGIPTTICLPNCDNCTTHYLTITTNSITVS